IAKMMQAGFTRLEAVEVQNQMKDLLEAMPEYMALERADQGDELFARHDTLVLRALEAAIASVKDQKHFESGFSPEPLKPSDFYVAFDMDETLLTQWYESGTKGSAYRDLDGLPKDVILRPALVGPDYLSMTPGWEKAFLDLAAIPGCKGVIVFSAKEDSAAQAIIDRLKIQGKPLRGFLKGVFTRNFLVRDNNKAEKLSKDLRIIDESLEHVVLVDDNPARIFASQVDNLREFPKYNPDAYYAARDAKDAARAKLIEQLMPTVVGEIREAADYSRKHSLPFIKAYYPYSMGGQAELLMLMKQGYSMPKAIEFLRDKHSRELFEPKFYVPK
ncbi:MAG TPA: NIF family HAD-type phosphatase, partial [Candidatus Obscuribacterales bacterium]